MLVDCCKNVTRVAKTLQHTAEGAMQQAALLTGRNVKLNTGTLLYWCIGIFHSLILTDLLLSAGAKRIIFDTLYSQSFY